MSSIHDVTERSDEFENTSKTVSKSKREESFEDTRHSQTDTVRDTKSITDSQTTKDSTTKINESITERTDVKRREMGTLDEKGNRIERKQETSDTITKNERESAVFEERSLESESASSEHTKTRTAGESERQWEMRNRTTGIRTETRIPRSCGRHPCLKSTARGLNDVITSRKELQNQLSKDQTELRKKSEEDTTRNTTGLATTDGTSSQLNKTNTQREEESSVVVNETSTQVDITQEMLRLKIIDVIGRFAGVASEYLNNFDLKRGPDVVFAVDNPLLATVVEKTIQWGLLRTPCPEDTLSIPQILFSDKYEADFWNEVIEAGLLEHLRIILTPVEKHTKIEMYCPTICTKDKFCNLTTLNLSGLELSQYQDDVSMSCKSLRSINISLCQIGQDDDSSYNTVSSSDILWLLTGKSDPIQSFPELLEFSFRNPVSSTKSKASCLESD
ncbi:hypothetical protein BDR26DRAFT_907106 [Obelidium mucronatum]|nr:hypothetical protein BDR26DRAFT_907106 [Obelidium mucronatum]